MRVSVGSGGLMPKQRRRHERIKRRLKVEYGDVDFRHSGMALDLSVGGLFLQARRIYDLNTYIHLHVIDREFDFYTEACVARIRRVDPRLRRIESEGMGIRFVSAAEIIKQRVPKAQRRVETNTVLCDSVETLETLLREQLAAGVLMVPVDENPDLQSVVEFTIRCEIGDTSSEVVGMGRIIQLLKTGDSPSAVLEVQNVAELLAELEGLL